MEKPGSSNQNSIQVEVDVKTEIAIRETIRTGIGQIIDHTVVTEDNTDKTEVSLGMNKITEKIILKET